jgi:hypothetical protein
MREVGGLIVRRECSHCKGSARFARSLTDQGGMDGKTIARVCLIQNSRDIGARGLVVREQEQRSVAMPKQHNKPLGLYVTEC